MVIKKIDNNVIILVVVLKDFTNRYGDKFEIGKIYHADGEVKWGNKGNGFHLCTNIEDCFRYVDPNNLLMTEVIGFGKMRKYDDEYYGYYDMYVCEYMRIIREISREEIIDMMLHTYLDRRNRFIRDFNLTEEELKLFEGVERYGQDNSERREGKQLKKY